MAVMLTGGKNHYRTTLRILWKQLALKNLKNKRELGSSANHKTRALGCTELQGLVYCLVEHSVTPSSSAEGLEELGEDGTCKTLTNRNGALNCRDFVKSAWADIERFKEQKNHDLKEALISYAVMQISMCKKVRRAGEGPCCWVSPTHRGSGANFQ